MVPTKRNQGLGGQFLSLIEKWLKIRQYQSLHIESSPEALPFYKRNPYREMPFDDPEAHETDPRDIPVGKTPMNYQITKGDLTPELREHIFYEFGKHAIAVVGIDGFGEEAISFKIYEGEIVAGCAVVHPFWGQLHIRYLLVEEPYRGRGLGKVLMQHVLEYGKQRGCRFAFLETMSFQAPEFYQKLGFKVELERDGYERGTSFYYLKKDL